MLPSTLRTLLSRARSSFRVLRRGAFWYENHDIFSPYQSVIFQRILRDGVFEPEIASAMCVLASPQSYVFDVGANIGVMSATMLARRRDVQVVSIECSPSTLPYLRKTIAHSPYKDRWRLFEVAAGKKTGELAFFTSGAANGAFDGLIDTGRGGATQRVVVQVATLDDIWRQLGRPHVSLLKIDIEGGEYDALTGAKDLIETCRPAILFEWHSVNLAAYGRKIDEIFQLKNEFYELRAVPHLQIVQFNILELLMEQNEMFLLIPATGFASCVEVA